MKYRLFIDDLRYPTTPDWFVARTSYDAIYAVEHYGMPYEIAYDFDLGGDDTAWDFFIWFEEQVVLGKITIPDDFMFSVHSANPVGKKRITEAMNHLLDNFVYKG